MTALFVGAFRNPNGDSDLPHRIFDSEEQARQYLVKANHEWWQLRDSAAPGAKTLAAGLYGVGEEE